MSNLNRPLSPHLQVYRFPLTVILSITHRITGAALCAGVVALSVWLLALADGPDAFNTVQSMLGSIPGKIIMFAFTFALFFHLGNGIRHLFWDAGYGFELATVDASAKAVLIVALVATILIWAIALTSGGGA
ncbi:MAG: succinate dehydrogenase / fumarate reductase cytochrome b subunit [Gammaproteobacteria bacterium]|jgi:succinate dehydrogenase / fumarate reductase cytochrome b subunit